MIVMNDSSKKPARNILQDPVYNRFYAAFMHMLETKWKGKQSLWGEASKVGKGTMTDIKKLRRKVSFEKRLALIEQCNMGYDEFISLGAKLLNQKEAQVSFYEEVVEKHIELITTRFKYKKEGLQANEALVDIQNSDRNFFFRLVGDLKAIALDLKDGKKIDLDIKTADPETQEVAEQSGTLGGDDKTGTGPG